MTGLLVAGFGAGTLILLAAPALAHMPVLSPSLFDAGKRDLVTIEASFTEDAFRPEIAMKDAPFEATGPDGTTVKLATPMVLTEVTLVEAKLPADGLYRVSSGQRFGRMNKMYRDGGQWKMVGEGAPAPAGVALVDAQSATLADVYILKGKPGGEGALKPRGTALEIVPLSDPSAYEAKAALPFAVHYDGKPLAGASVELFREAGFYDGKKQVAEVKSDAAGKVAFTAPDAGRYVLLVRHRDAAPVAGKPLYSFTVTLAFEAM
jgi:uncharacterized GH25 family protein